MIFIFSNGQKGHQKWFKLAKTMVKKKWFSECLYLYDEHTVEQTWQKAFYIIVKNNESRWNRRIAPWECNGIYVLLGDEWRKIYWNQRAPHKRSGNETFLTSIKIFNTQSKCLFICICNEIPYFAYKVSRKQKCVRVVNSLKHLSKKKSRTNRMNSGCNSEINIWNPIACFWLWSCTHTVVHTSYLHFNRMCCR